MVGGSMLQALIFDFDGLIVDTETVIVEVWERMHHEAELVCDRAVLHALVGSADEQADVWSAFPVAESRVELDRRWREVVRELTRSAPILPGVGELIKEARAAGLRLAVASNSQHRHVDRHLEHRGLLDSFDAIVCRDDVRVGKPDPEVYVRALERLGVSAAEAVALEDSKLGHLAAHAAGLPVMVVPNPSTAHDTFAHAAWRRDSMAGLTLAALRELHRAQREASARA